MHPFESRYTGTPLIGQLLFRDGLQSLPHICISLISRLFGRHPARRSGAHENFSCTIIVGLAFSAFETAPLTLVSGSRSLGLAFCLPLPISVPDQAIFLSDLRGSLHLDRSVPGSSFLHLGHPVFHCSFRNETLRRVFPGRTDGIATCGQSRNDRQDGEIKRNATKEEADLEEEMIIVFLRFDLGISL